MNSTDREGGYIVLHRQVFSSAVWQLPALQRHVWTTLLLVANWRESVAPVAGRLVTVPRGSALVTERTLAERAGVSRGLVRRSLVAFAKLGMVSFTDIGPGAKGGPTVRMINVLKYRDYQDAKAEPRPNHGTNHGTHQKNNASPTEKRASPKASPFPPAFWRVLKHYGCPQLDRADKGQVLQRLKAGELLEDLVAKIVIGISYGARSPRGALTYTRQFNDPITRLEMDDVRSAYRRLAAEEHGPRDGAGRRAGDSTAQPPAQLGLPEVGAADAAQLGAVHGPGGQAGPV